MKKWYNEEYEFEIEVTGFLRGDHTEHYCRNGEEVGIAKSNASIARNIVRPFRGDPPSFIYPHYIGYLWEKQLKKTYLKTGRHILR